MRSEHVNSKDLDRYEWTREYLFNHYSDHTARIWYHYTWDKINKYLGIWVLFRQRK